MDCTTLAPIGLVPTSEMYSPVASRTINPGSVFDKLPVQVRNNIFGRCCLEWTGEMPAVIVAMRISPVAYGCLLDIFYGSNAFTLHAGNKWSLYGMSKYAVATIQTLEIIVCTCYLTDGSSNTWLTPLWYSPAKTGANNVRNIALIPAPLHRIIAPTERFPVPFSEMHDCPHPSLVLEHFVHKFPYFLTPFKNVREVHTLFSLWPWYNEDKGTEGLGILRKIVQKTVNILEVNVNIDEFRDATKPSVELGQLCMWKVDDDKDVLMDWSMVGENAIVHHEVDWECFIDWEGEQDVSGEQDGSDGLDRWDGHGGPDEQDGLGDQEMHDVPDEHEMLDAPDEHEIHDTLDEHEMLDAPGQQKVVKRKRKNENLQPCRRSKRLRS
ncbi:uncharacterized protein BP5553_06067 [Venustampulla echinocandica]|uniref:Uncharacterized protein n=1 Tax=Venustampulla echinocandica TaxID=2656787 RepID=A0A370TMH7_9HELO|nr:uncharacterized protein BP5553_06067 [Venustampulla echinocandica]RDL36715.1 hypothetical protein BP5553_06067 [Venustampulla echinocandica]